MLLLIPALLFSGVAAQARSQTTPKTAAATAPEALNLPDASSASHGAEPNAQGLLPWSRGGIPAYPQNSRPMDLRDKLVS